MARKSQTTPPAAAAATLLPGIGEAPVSFEDALQGLESIVSAMEEDHLPLEDLVANYEKGSRLLAHCETVLQSARKRLQTITDRQAAGNAADLPDSLDGGSRLAEDAVATLPDARDDDDDDIRLF